MRLEKNLLRLTLRFVLFALLGGLGSISLYANSVRLPSINIQKGTKYAYSKSFWVTNKGELKVTVKVAVSGLFGSGGTSRYRVVLMRENREVQVKYVTTSAAGKNVYLRYVVSNCNQKGRYKIRIKNYSSSNPQPGIASFNPFYPPKIKMTSYDMPSFSVSKNRTVIRDIPRQHEPKSLGRIILTANWAAGANCFLSPVGCRLGFRLKRNNKYTYLKPNVSSGNFKIEFELRRSEIGGDWKVEVIGSPNGNVSNVRTRIRFFPKCS